MRTVVYALNEPAYAAHRAHVLEQLRSSVASLRAHNESVRVVVFTYGDLRADLAPLADSCRVEIVEKGSYAEALARASNASIAEVLTHYPVLHKWLALADTKQPPGDQLLYVDNDTFFFGDVAAVFDRSTASDFFAREEPFSSRSHAGYRPEYIDETKLFALASSEGSTPLPTYNLGVVVLNHSLTERLAPRIGELLGFVSRFCLGIVRDADRATYAGQPWLEHLDAHRDRLTSTGDLGDALAYPSTNVWIVEQLALLLALGRIPGFTHDVLTRQEAMQGVEYHFWPKDEPLPPLAHYYSSNTRAFFEWQTRRAANR